MKFAPILALLFTTPAAAQVIHVKASDFAPLRTASEDFEKLSSGEVTRPRVVDVPHDAASATADSVRESATDQADLFLASMLAENNRIRAAAGLPAQVLDQRLCEAAQEQAEYLSRTGQFDHHVNGDPRTRAARRGFRGIVRENLAGPFQSVANAFRGWCGSPGHYASIVSDCDVAGFGYAPGVYCAVYGKSSPASHEPPAATVQSQPQASERNAPPSVTTPRGASYKLVRSCNGQTCTMQYVPVQPQPKAYVPQQQGGFLRRVFGR